MLHYALAYTWLRPLSAFDIPDLLVPVILLLS